MDFVVAYGLLQIEQRANLSRPRAVKPARPVRISANVTADFGNVTDSAGLVVARC
jgi:hypothetical protein